MTFPCMEFILVIFQVFHDFQSLWEPWNFSYAQLNSARNFQLLNKT